MTHINLNKHAFIFFFLRILTLIVIFSICFEQKLGLATAETKKEIVSVEYIPGWKDKNSDIVGVIHFELNPGWKTYWRNPGLFGITPIIDWSASENISNMEISWPTPRIFHEYGVKVIGYETSLSIPIKITKEIFHEKAILNLNLTFGICSDICLLKQKTISAPVENDQSNKNFDFVSKALATVPSKITDHAFPLSKCMIEKDGDKLYLKYLISLSEKSNSTPAIIIEYAFSDISIKNQIVKIDEEKLYVSASLQDLHKAEGAIERNRIKALLILENKGFTITGCH